MVFVSQLVFASICRSFWECGLVAIDDISISHGDCQITAGKDAKTFTTMIVVFLNQPETRNFDWDHHGYMES